MCEQVHVSPLTHIPLGKMAALLADDNFKCLFLNENDIIPIPISLKFLPRSPIENKPAFVQVMFAWTNADCWPSSQMHIWGGGGGS